MPTDHEPSNGYEHHAGAFAAHRNGSAIGNKPPFQVPDFCREPGAGQIFCGKD